MTDQNKLKELQLERENLELKLAIEKESNKNCWNSWIWVLVPVVGMVIGTIYRLY